MKARRELEAKELARLRKELNDFVQKHVAAGTAAGSGYEKAVKKRQDAVDEYYAGTEAGKDVARRKKAKQAAAAKSVELEKQITELREAPGSQSRETKRKLEGLEKEREAALKKARGVKKDHEADAAKRRSEATSAVTKLRRELGKAVRERRAEDVAKLGKDLTKAERLLELLEANDRRKERLDGLGNRLVTIVARARPGTALAQDAEMLCKVLAVCRRPMRLDTSTENEALAAAVLALEKARCGGGKVRKLVEKAVEAVEPGDNRSGRKRRSSEEVSESASRYRFNVTLSLRRRRRDAVDATRRRVDAVS